MAITKQLWDEVQKTLSGMYCNVQFKLPTGEKITVQKLLVSENKLALVVWMDDKQCAGWGWPSRAEFRPVVKLVWHRKTFRAGASAIKRVSKMKGGKAFLKRKENAHLFEVVEYWEPYFSTAASLVRQFKKIEGLELEPDSLSKFVEISG